MSFLGRSYCIIVIFYFVVGCVGHDLYCGKAGHRYEETNNNIRNHQWALEHFQNALAKACQRKAPTIRFRITCLENVQGGAAIRKYCNDLDFCSTKRWQNT